MATSSDEIRLLLVGKTGKGKSTTGNNILGKKLFNSSPSASSVTMDCELRRNMRNGTMIEIMDAPGLFDTSKPQTEILGHILKAVACMIPGPDAVLFVLSIERFTDEEYEAYTALKTAFDANITKYIILIFTNGERLQEMPFTEWLKTAPKGLKNVCTEVENRCMTINNFAGKLEIENKIDILLQIIRNLISANGRVPYSCPKYAKVGEEFEKELNKRLEEEELKAIQKSNAYKKQVAKDNKLLQEEKEKVEREKREQEKKIKEEKEKQQRQKAEFEKEKQRKEYELKEKEREQQRKIQEEEEKQQRQKAEFEKEKQRKERELNEREREQQKKIQEEEGKQQRQKAEFEKEKQRKERELKEREREQQKKIQEEEEKQQRLKEEFEKEKQRKEYELKERERKQREDEEERRKERLENERYLKEKEERLRQEEERRQEMIRRMKDEIAENRNPSFWSKFKDFFVGIGEFIGEGIDYLFEKLSSD